MVQRIPAGASCVHVSPAGPYRRQCRSAANTRGGCSAERRRTEDRRRRRARRAPNRASLRPSCDALLGVRARLAILSPSERSWLDEKAQVYRLRFQRYVHPAVTQPAAGSRLLDPDPVHGPVHASVQALAGSGGCPQGRSGYVLPGTARLAWPSLSWSRIRANQKRNDRTDDLRRGGGQRGFPG